MSTSPNEKLYQIKAPHFTAGIITQNGWITEAAPILNYAKGKALTWLEAYCNKRRWRITEVKPWKP